LLCTSTARSIMHGEYKWRKFVDADKSGVISDMYEGRKINCTHCRFPSFSSVHQVTFETVQARAFRHSLIRRSGYFVLLNRGSETRVLRAVRGPPVTFMRLSDFNYAM
jgi:hypothetical protein